MSHFSVLLNLQECETKIAQEIASLSKEDVSKEEMSENEEEVINLLLAQVRDHLFRCYCYFHCVLDAGLTLAQLSDR